MKSERMKNRFHTGTDGDSMDSKDPRRSAAAAKVSGTMIGRIVQSTAGRDSDRCFVIVKEVDASYIMIADGRLRHIDHPKKKKLRHCKLLSFAGMECVEKIADGTCSDSYLRRVISAFRGEVSGNEEDTGVSGALYERRDSSAER